jgi:hypothetical protein
MWLPGGDQLGQVAHVLLERRGRAVGVHEDPSAPLVEARSNERIRCLVEALEIAEARRRGELAVERVDPGVVRALDGAEVPRRCGLEQLVSAMAARVVEASELSVAAPNREDALVADPERALISCTRQILGPPHADPPLLEQVDRLPVEDRLGCVGLGRKRPGPAERGLEHVSQQFDRDRARRHGEVPPEDGDPA